VRTNKKAPSRKGRGKPKKPVSEATENVTAVKPIAVEEEGSDDGEIVETPTAQQKTRLAIPATPATVKALDDGEIDEGEIVDDVPAPQKHMEDGELTSEGEVPTNGLGSSARVKPTNGTDSMEEGEIEVTESGREEGEVEDDGEILETDGAETGIGESEESGEEIDVSKDGEEMDGISAPEAEEGEIEGEEESELEDRPEELPEDDGAMDAYDYGSLAEGDGGEDLLEEGEVGNLGEEDDAEEIRESLQLSGFEGNAGEPPSAEDANLNFGETLLGQLGDNGLQLSGQDDDGDGDDDDDDDAASGEIVEDDAENDGDGLESADDKEGCGED